MFFRRTRVLEKRAEHGNEHGILSARTLLHNREVRASERQLAFIAIQPGGFGARRLGCHAKRLLTGKKLPALEVIQN